MGQARCTYICAMLFKRHMDKILMFAGRIKPLGAEAGHASGQMVLVASSPTLAAGLRCSDLCHKQRRHRGCVFSSGTGLRKVGTVEPMTQVALGSCLAPGRSRGWKHLAFRTRALAS